MSPQIQEHERPTRFRVIQTRPTSTSVAQITTDKGSGFLKVLGNPQGPHALAADVVGTLLADWIGLPTADWCILPVSEAATFDLPGGRRSDPGPAFFSRELVGAEPWSGDPAELNDADNPEALSGLVILDTWIRNRDRFPPIRVDGSQIEPGRAENLDNLLLHRPPGKKAKIRIVPIDFGEAFRIDGEVSPKLGHIGVIRDEAIYGLCKQFAPFLKTEWMRAAAAKAASIEEHRVRAMLTLVPREWEVKPAAMEAWLEFIVDRASWIGEDFLPKLLPFCGAQEDLDFGGTNDV